jgi:hypothetical protein
MIVDELQILLAAKRYIRLTLWLTAVARDRGRASAGLAGFNTAERGCLNALLRRSFLADIFESIDGVAREREELAVNC